jgi:putative membrane protein (TIGR04086 family)
MINVNDDKSNNFIKILKGSAISLFATLILLMIFSAILTYTNINENSMPTVIIVITTFSILLGSQITTAQIKKSGIINGTLVGGIYIMFLYIISSIVSKNFSLNIYSIIMIATSLLIGGIGGIIGVNRK